MENGDEDCKNCKDYKALCNYLLTQNEEWGKIADGWAKIYKNKLYSCALWFVIGIITGVTIALCVRGV